MLQDKPINSLEQFQAAIVMFNNAQSLVDIGLKEELESCIGAIRHENLKKALIDFGGQIIAKLDLCEIQESETTSDAAFFIFSAINTMLKKNRNLTAAIAEIDFCQRFLIREIMFLINNQMIECALHRLNGKEIVSTDELQSVCAAIVNKLVDLLLIVFDQKTLITIFEIFADHTEAITRDTLIKIIDNKIQVLKLSSATQKTIIYIALVLSYVIAFCYCIYTYFLISTY